MLLKSSSPAGSGKSKAVTATANVTFTGIGVSGGIVIGRALLLGREIPAVPEIELAADDVDAEIERFRQALEISQQQLTELKNRVAKIIGEKDASIFDAHLMLVADKVLIDEVIAQIIACQRNAEFVFSKVINHYSKALENVHDAYIRDRLTDIRDVAARVIGNLLGEGLPDLTHLTEPRIVIANDLAPSHTATMDRNNVIGFATCIGSRTSHTAIMARSLKIPAVVGVIGVNDVIRNGDLILLDGYRGQIIVRPDDELIAEGKRRIESQRQWMQRIIEEAALPAETIDGFRVQLAANIELPDEIESFRKNYGVGIGLFRTEYLFIDKDKLPDEEEQFQAYRRVAQEIYPQSVIFRTLDIGGDKFLTNMALPMELNPFLGMRAIRFCLSRPEIFKTQLRAIMRASAHGKVRILFPLISTLEEVIEATAYLEEVKRELDSQRIAYNRHLDVGIMIEVPSAALLADKLAQYVDFFSVGTNDLIQYSLAADRANPKIAYLYQPCHPSIIRLLKETVEAAWRHGIWVSICGEMASDPLVAPLIMGLGIHELSMSPVAIGIIKRVVRHIRMHEAEALVHKALQCGTAAEVMEICDDFINRVAPDVLPGR